MDFAFALDLAALPGEMYWRSVFPNTPMPKALRNLLIPTTENKNVLCDAVKNKDKVADGFGNYAHANPSKQFADCFGNYAYANPSKESTDSFGNYKYANPSKEFANGIPPTKSDAYFFESDLHPGRKMNLKELSRKASKASFLPRSVAESIPFSTQKFPKVLKYFSLEAKSAEANILKETIENCERPAIAGEEK
ncbi:hypothetical protein PTKIN_Ptkin11bG0091900 [Pterospermum kingtungense]